MTMLNFKIFKKLSTFSKVSIIIIVVLRIHLASKEGMLICSCLLIKNAP